MHVRPSAAFDRSGKIFHSVRPELELISLNQARNDPALRHAGRGDRRPDPATMHRWARRGVLVDGRRIRLETVKMPGKLMTTREAISRFVAKLNEAGPAPLAEADVARLAHQRAEAELDAAGI